MKYSQQDIVEINFLFPDGKSKPHPAIIISNAELYETEGYFYLALISSKNYNPEYSYKIEDDMINFQFSKVSYIKCQIIVGNIDRDIVRKLGRMKEPFFSEMKAKIIEAIF